MDKTPLNTGYDNIVNIFRSIKLVSVPYTTLVMITVLTFLEALNWLVFLI